MVIARLAHTYLQSHSPVYAAINYIVLSRILFYVPYLSPIHPGRVLTTFLAADAVCEILIVNGVQRLVNSRFDERNRQIGGDLTKAGLILQAVLFVLFVLLAVVFHLRAIKAGVMRPTIRTVLIVLYISCTIITARCIYRIVEFFEWGNGPLTHQEAYFWIFEATIMIINTVMLNVWHPGKYLPRSNKNFLAKDGSTVLRGPGWEDKRPFIVTFLDPFDLWGLATGRDKKTRFWDMNPAELAALDAADRKKKEEKLARGRPLWAKVLDPLHLFGSQGRIVAFAKTLEKDTTPRKSSSIVGSSSEKTKGEEAV
jgi:hypothetical protein